VCRLRVFGSGGLLNEDWSISLNTTRSLRIVFVAETMEPAVFQTKLQRVTQTSVIEIAAWAHERSYRVKLLHPWLIDELTPYINDDDAPGRNSQNIAQFYSEPNAQTQPTVSKRR